MAAGTSPQRAPGSGRVTRQRYWIRRLGVVAVLAVIGYAVVTAVAGQFGGDSDAGTIVSPSGDDGSGTTGGAAAATDGDAAADGEGASDAASGSGAAGIVDESADAGAASPDSVPTTENDADDEPGPPTASNPAKVYIVGDSDAGTFGPYLQKLLDGTLIAETELNYKVSSGLARPDFFNWPEELRAALPAADPDIVVVTFGGNDSQGLSLPEQPTNFIIGDPVANEAEWSEEYQRRAGEVMDLLLENDRKVIWVGIPNDDNDDVTARLAIQDRAAKAAAAERPDVVFVDTWARFSGRDGNWAEFVVDPRDNVGKDVRADDGFHLNENGAEILAIDIAVEVQEALRELGAAI